MPVYNSFFFQVTSRSIIGTPFSLGSLDSIFDTPKKASLRRNLKKKILHVKKQSQRIKILLQKNRRLKKKNTSIQNILVHLRKERFINTDVSNILSENVFAAQLYNLNFENFAKH